MMRLSLVRERAELPGVVVMGRFSVVEEKNRDKGEIVRSFTEFLGIFFLCIFKGNERGRGEQWDEQLVGELEDRGKKFIIIFFFFGFLVVEDADGGEREGRR